MKMPPAVRRASAKCFERQRVYWRDSDGALHVWVRIHTGLGIQRMMYCGQCAAPNPFGPGDQLIEEAA